MKRIKWYFVGGLAIASLGLLAGSSDAAERGVMPEPQTLHCGALWDGVHAEIGRAHV